MPTYTLLATATLTSGNSRVQFSSISSNYTDLVMIGRFMGSDTCYIGVQFNTDTSTTNTNYSSTYWQGTSPGKQTNTYVIAGGGTNSPTTNDATTVHIDINKYSATDRYKTAMIRNGNAPISNVNYSQGTWRNTAAINAVEIYSANGNNFGAGTELSLYGIKAG
jgi:hypothetical protein